MNKASHGCLLFFAALVATGNAQAHGARSNDGHGDTQSVSEVDREQQEWGVAAHASEASRTIEVTMDDNMRFAPASISVKQGETITFIIENRGKLLHEMVLGTSDSLASHAALMVKFPGMEHAEPYMAHVSPGDKGEITWTFNRDGNVGFACLVPGHFDAGMQGEVLVE